MSELGAGNNAEYEAPRDQQTPKLHTSSAPPEGSKMKAGDRIRMTMLARRRGPAADRSQDNLTRCRENVGSQFLSLRQSVLRNFLRRDSVPTKLANIRGPFVSKPPHCRGAFAAGNCLSCPLSLQTFALGPFSTVLVSPCFWLLFSRVHLRTVRRITWGAESREWPTPTLIFLRFFISPVRIRNAWIGSEATVGDDGAAKKISKVLR